jgi:hypothetical protein
MEFDGFPLTTAYMYNCRLEYQLHLEARSNLPAAID